MSRLWWIDADRLAGHPNPTESELRRLMEQGFAAVLCLLGHAEAPGYDAVAARARGLAWLRVPVPDFTPPTLEQIEEGLAFVERSLAGGKVMIHCMGGSGRTGTFAACHWVARGLSADAAIARVKAANHRAIETPEQCAAVAAFAHALRTGSR
jgi:atypical dual specificity phosphatase